MRRLPFKAILFFSFFTVVLFFCYNWHVVYQVSRDQWDYQKPQKKKGPRRSVASLPTANP